MTAGVRGRLWTEVVKAGRCGDGPTSEERSPEAQLVELEQRIHTAQVVFALRVGEGGRRGGGVPAMHGKGCRRMAAQEERVGREGWATRYEERGCPACRAARNSKLRAFRALAANAGRAERTTKHLIGGLRAELAGEWREPRGKRIARATPAHVQLGQCEAVNRGEVTAHLRKNMYDVLRTVEAVEEDGGQCANTVRRAAHIVERVAAGEDVDGEDAAPVIAVIAGCLPEPRVGAAVTAGARSKVVAAVQVLQAGAAGQVAHFERNARREAWRDAQREGEREMHRAIVRAWREAARASRAGKTATTAEVVRAVREGWQLQRVPSEPQRGAAAAAAVRLQHDGHRAEVRGGWPLSVVPAETSWWWDGAAASVQMAGTTAAAARRRAAAAGAEVQPTRGGAQRARREQQNAQRGGARDGGAEQHGGPRDDGDGRIERRSALEGAHAAAEEARANICGVRRCERSAVNVTTPLYVQKARILATYVRLVKRGDDRLAAARSKGERARTRWREGAKLAVAWAREQASRAATEAERARSLAARGDRVTARTRAAAGGATPGRYTEARQKVPNGEREVHARQCGGHVTVRARLGVRLGQMLDALCRARKERG